MRSLLFTPLIIAALGVVTIAEVAEADPDKPKPGAAQIETLIAALSKSEIAAVKGKIQFVDSFPDYKVQVVTSFPDLKVKKVASFADDVGEWQIVDSFPDFKIQIVTSFPDFKIKYVDSFPGLP